MSWDDYDSTYYLTESGWSTDTAAAKSAVWTVTLNIYQQSGFSRERLNWRVSAPKDKAMAKQLLVRFPSPAPDGCYIDRSTAAKLRSLLLNSD